MLKIFLGFLPWILYLVIVGNTREQHLIAILVTLGVMLLVDYKTLKKGFVLSWGTLLFFITLLPIVYLVHSNWPEMHAGLLASSALALIAWTSLIINKPFTLQYAKEEVDPLYWKSKRFLFVNQMITLAWSLTFTLQILLSLSQSIIDVYSHTFYRIISYAPFFIAVLFTKKFPNWYRGYCFRKYSQVKEDPTKNPYLQGNFAPIKKEVSTDTLAVEGELPKDINGVYMRNGPNPMFDPISYTYPIDGDGMLHAVYFDEGEAHYRNRWVKTKGLLAEEKAGKALYGGIRRPIPTDPKLIGKDGDPGPIKDGAFIHVIQHAHKIIAMYEAGIAYEVTKNLETIGPWCPKGIAAPFNVNAHTRFDAARGELIAFTYDFHAPYLRYYVINSEGRVTQNVAIDKPYASMIHDVVMTDDYVIFFDCPAVFDFDHMDSGEGLLRWKPELGVKIILVNRHTQVVTMLQTETFFVYHFANAHQSGDQIFIDYVRHEKLFLGVGEPSRIAPALYRATLNLKNKTVQHHKCSDYKVEFPRINDHWHGRNNRYIYAPTRVTQDSVMVFNAILRYDTVTQATLIHDFGEFSEVDEAVYIPRDNSTREDDGYLGLFVYDKRTQGSDFVLLSAEAIQDKPLVRVHMPQRVPHGLHGSWMHRS